MRNITIVVLGVLAVLVVWTLSGENTKVQSTTEEKPLTDQERDAIRRKVMQLMAQTGIRQLHQRNAFQLLNQDFQWSRPWKACTRISYKRTNKFHAVLLGGSSSARPAVRCTDGPEADPRGGRYSNMLQNSLHSHGWDAKIVNLAQGSSTSVWNGMMLDQLLNATDDSIDLIIWDHSTNDHSPESNGTPQQMLRFWFSRLHNLYATLHKSPPPILLLYLWKFNIGNQPDDYLLQHGIAYQGPEFQDSLQVVDEYTTNLGWDIQVINIADLMTPQTFVAHRQRLIDDRHHPACQGAHLLSDILQYALEDHILQNDACSIENQETDNPPTLPPPPTSNRLIDILFSPQTTMGAFSQWQPKLPKAIPALPMTTQTLDEVMLHTFNLFPMADMPGRDDRKFGLQIPLCDDNQHPPLELTLEMMPATWQWLLIVFAGSGILLTLQNHDRIPLLGQGAQVSSGFPDPVLIPRVSHDWLDLESYHDDDHLQLAFCDNSTVQERTTSQGKIQKGWIHLMVGVAAAVQDGS